MLKHLVDFNTKDKEKMKKQVQVRITETQRTQASARLFISKLFPNLSIKEMEKSFITLTRAED